MVRLISILINAEISFLRICLIDLHPDKDFIMHMQTARAQMSLHTIAVSSIPLLFDTSILQFFEFLYLHSWFEIYLVFSRCGSYNVFYTPQNRVLGGYTVSSCLSAFLSVRLSVRLSACNGLVFPYYLKKSEMAIHQILHEL